jgi:hypothetical protein
VIEIRRATLADIPAVVSLAVESVLRDPLPVRIDREAMAETAKAALGPQHFLWVAEVEGQVVAAVGAVVQPGFWFERMSCSVLLYYTRVPGAGLPLLRAFARWVKSRPAIKTAVFELEPNADPRLVRFIQRLGFSRSSQNLTFVRGMT